MSKRNVLITIIVIFIAILAWDVALYSDSVEGNSITQVVIALSADYPLVPYAIGYLFGFLTAHFFDTTKQV